MKCEHEKQLILILKSMCWGCKHLDFSKKYCNKLKKKINLYNATQYVEENGGKCEKVDNFHLENKKYQEE
jgi:hypothetical protein